MYDSSLFCYVIKLCTNFLTKSNLFTVIDTTTEKECQASNKQTLVIEVDLLKTFDKRKSSKDLKARVKSNADFETAIELAGYGKFHYILLAICGLVSTSEEMDVSVF